MADRTDSCGRPGRVFLWMIPRTVSTAFAKCLSGIPECEVWYEPFTYCQFAKACLKREEGLDLPPRYEGNEKLYARAAAFPEARFGIKFPPERLSYNNIRNAIEGSSSKYVFVKDNCIAMYTEEDRKYLPSDFKHVFLIRHPYLVFASLRIARFSQMRLSGQLPNDVEDESQFDLRTSSIHFQPNLFQSIYSLWKYIREEVAPDAIVIDSSDFLAKSADALPKFCEAVGLPYDDSLIEWDGTLETAKRWIWPSDELIYASSTLDISMTSSKFFPPKQPLPREQLTDDVIELSDEAMPLYQEMYEHRLRF